MTCCRSSINVRQVIGNFRQVIGNVRQVIGNFKQVIGNFRRVIGPARTTDVSVFYPLLICYSAAPLSTTTNGKRRNCIVYNIQYWKCEPRVKYVMAHVQCRVLNCALELSYACQVQCNTTSQSVQYYKPVSRLPQAFTCGVCIQADDELKRA